MNARITNQIATAFFWFSGILIFGLLLVMLGYIFWKGLPILTPKFLFGMPSDITEGGGVGPQLFNSLYILVLSMLVTAPIGLGAGIYLSEYAEENQVTKMIRLSVESLATVPSIVLGLFGMIIFLNLMGLRFSILAGSLSLALLNLPVLVRVTEEAFRSVPIHHRAASYALGATKWQTLWRVLFPSALPGIMTGMTLVINRAIGESAILIFTAGTAVSRFLPDFDLMAGGETLAVHLWYVMGVGLVPDRVLIAEGISALLILIVFFINLLFMVPVYFVKKRTQG